MRLLIIGFAFGSALRLAIAQDTPEKELAHSVLKELIEIDTSDPLGDNTRAAEAMAARFRGAGFAPSDIHVLAPADRKGNVVVRFHGKDASRKPILFMGHLDVVAARREDWSRDPFKLIDEDGYYYGRGTQDMKSDDALLVTTFLRLKKEGFVPARDLILALTADEEVGHNNGVQWLLKEHRDLIDCEYAINADAGGGQIKNGKRELMGVQAAEKTYATYHLDVRNPGGHSSLPTTENAIYQLADALGRLEKFTFPAKLNEVTQSFFERMGAITKDDTAADFRAVSHTPPDAAAVERLSRQPYYNAQLRTTCIPTELKAGHSENALPQLAEAVVNCRILPNDSAQMVEDALRRVVADPKVEISPTAEVLPSPFSPLRPDVLNAITGAVESVWGRLPVVPLMETGATDGKFLRIAGVPVYGVSALFLDIDDIRAHGRDERVPKQSFYDGVRFDYELVKRLASE